MNNKILNEIDKIQIKIKDTEENFYKEINYLKYKISTLKKNNNISQINKTTAYRHSDKLFFELFPKFSAISLCEPTTIFSYSDTISLSENYEPNAPYISVIIPIYNVEKYLAKTLDCILIQTLKNIEIICVNDGSTDNSGKILEKYSQKDNRIKIINKSNGGQASARNEGLKIAKGKYIGFMDSDDLIPKDYYEVLYKNALRYDADVVQCRYLMIYDDGKEEPWELNPLLMASESRNIWFKNKLMLTYASGVVWNKIYKKEILNNIKFIEDSSPWEDNPFIMMVLQAAKKIISVPDVYYYYLQRNNSSIHELNTKVHFQLLKSSEYIIDFLNNPKNKISKKDYKEFSTLLIDRLHCEYSRMHNNSNATKKELKKYDKIHYRLFFKIKYLSFPEKISCMIEFNSLKKHLKNFFKPFKIIELFIRLIKNILLSPYHFIKGEF